MVGNEFQEIVVIFERMWILAYYLKIKETDNINLYEDRIEAWRVTTKIEQG